MDEKVVSIDCGYPVRMLSWYGSNNGGNTNYLVTTSLHYSKNNVIQVSCIVS